MPGTDSRPSNGTSWHLITQDQVHEAIIAQRKAQLTSIESDLQRYRSQMQEALALQEDLLRAIALHQSYIAPIRKVPNEVLGIILFEFVETAPLHERYLLALVSRRWRDVLNGTPAAWRRIFLSWEDRKPKMDATRLQVARAGTIPLIIHVDVTIVANSEYLEADICDWYTLVKDRSWTSFTLASRTTLASLDGLQPFLLHGLSNRLNTELLQECYLLISHEDSPSPSRSILQHAKKLQYLEISCSLVPPSNSVCKNLRELTIGADWGNDKEPELIPMLRECSSLESLFVDIGIPPRIEELNSPFNLPHLRHLSVGDVEITSSRFFYIVGTPTLEILEINSFTYEDPDDLIQDFYDFINHPFPIPPLKKLVLRWMKVPDERLTWFLGHLTDLEELVIEHSTDTTGKLLEYLADDAPQFWCARNLKTLEINNCPSLESPMFKSLIHARVRDLPSEIPGQGKNPKMFPTVPLTSVLLDGVDMIEMFN